MIRRMILFTHLNQDNKAIELFLIFIFHELYLFLIRLKLVDSNLPYK